MSADALADLITNHSTPQTAANGRTYRRVSAMIVSSGSLMNAKRRFPAVVVSVILAFGLLLTGPLYPAPSFADDPVEVGLVASATFDRYGPKGITGWGCNVSMYWTTASNAENFIRASYSCGTGKLQDGIRLRMFIDPEPAPADGTNCPRLYVVSDSDIDETDQNSGSFGPVSAGTGCGAVTQVCTEEHKNGTWASLKCVNIDLGMPPGVVDPDNLPAGECPRGKPMKPWVTELHPEAVSGGWAWVSEGVMRVADHVLPVSLDSSTGTGAATYGSKAMFLFAFVRTTGATYNNGLRITSPVPSSGGQVGSGTSQAQALSAIMDRTGGVDWTSVQFAWKVVGPTLTSAIGTGTPNWSYDRIGYYVSPSANQIFTTSQGGTTPIVEATYGTTNDGRQYAGNHQPAQCYFNWGNQVGAARTGPVTFQPATTPTPPVYVPPNTTPPVIEVDPDGSGCTADPAPEYCVAPPSTGAPPSVPDPDSEGCDFSITDPSTWGGQIICALAALAGAIIDAIMGVLDFLGGLIGALLDLLSSLFIPTGEGFGGGLDGLRGLWDDGPGGQWVDVFQPPDEAPMRGMGIESFSGSSASGGCEGPTIDVGSLGLDSDVINIEPMQPFAACTGTTATVAENVRTWTGVGLVLGGGFKIFEMILGAFGAMRQVRIMSDHDWSGRF